MFDDLDHAFVDPREVVLLCGAVCLVGLPSTARSKSINTVSCVSFSKFRNNEKEGRVFYTYCSRPDRQAQGAGANEHPGTLLAIIASGGERFSRLEGDKDGSVSQDGIDRQNPTASTLAQPKQSPKRKIKLAHWPYPWRAPSSPVRCPVHQLVPTLDTRLK